MEPITIKIIILIVSGSFATKFAQSYNSKAFKQIEFTDFLKKMKVLCESEKVVLSIFIFLCKHCRF
ncbi:hypothetical protein CBW18_07840 [Pedobacter sp. AJM]|nr:hypothetical protein CBW18_07840 [Pedobacter sp. AJM]